MLRQTEVENIIDNFKNNVLKELQQIVQNILELQESIKTFKTPFCFFKPEGIQQPEVVQPTTTTPQQEPLFPVEIPDRVPSNAPELPLSPITPEILQEQIVQMTEQNQTASNVTPATEVTPAIEEVTVLEGREDI